MALQGVCKPVGAEALLPGVVDSDCSADLLEAWQLERMQRVAFVDQERSANLNQVWKRGNDVDLVQAVEGKTAADVSAEEHNPSTATVVKLPKPFPA